MLSNQDKIKLYGLITSEFKAGVEYPLAKVALYLTNQGLNYQEFGYKKMKTLLMDLPEFLTLEEKKSDKGHADVVRIHAFTPVKQTDASQSTKKKKTPVVHQKAKGNIKPSLTKETKDQIIALLKPDFRSGVVYPMSKISKFLTDHKIHYKELGFSRMLLLYQAMPEFFQIQSDAKKQNGQIDLTLNFPLSPKPTPAPKKEEKNRTPKKKTTPPAKVQAVNETVFLPEKLILSLKEQNGIALSNTEISKSILADYEKAKQSHTLISRDDAFIFPLAFSGKDGSPLIGSVKPTSEGSDYGYYVNFVGTDREKPKDYLKNRVYFANLDQDLEALANLAKKESWCYHNSSDRYIILKIYLQYTFYRIISQNRLSMNPNSDFVAFNTGLVTSDYDAIYGVMMKSHDSKIKEPYLFQGFTVAANQGLGKIIVELFNPLPLKATYADSYQDYFYDPDSNLHTDFGHIILDNLDRFPLSFLGTMILPFKEERTLLRQIIEAKNEYRKEVLFEVLEDKVSKNEALFNLLKISLSATIEKSVRMVRDDYHMALPSFFPTREVMSIMLPLEFEKGAGVQAVLLIEKTQSGNYQGQTIFTLKQCYCNARLLGSLANTYLDPKKIED